MKISVLSCACQTQALARKYGIEKDTLLHMNALARADILPEGLSLLLPDGKERKRKQKEFFLFATGRDVQEELFLHYASAVCMPFRLDEDETEREKTWNLCRRARTVYAIPLLCLDNRDEDGFYSPEQAHILLRDKEKQKGLLEKMLERLVEAGGQGVLLAMDYLFPFDREHYLAFAALCSEALHHAGFWFYCMIPAETAKKPFSRRHAAFDLMRLNELCDRIVLLEAPCMMAEIRETALKESVLLCDPGKTILLAQGGAWVYPNRDCHNRQRMSACSAHALAVCAQGRIRRSGKGDPAFFSVLAPDGTKRAISYADVLWGAEFMNAAEKYALAGFGFLGETVFPGNTTLLRTCIAAEKLL